MKIVTAAIFLGLALAGNACGGVEYPPDTVINVNQSPYFADPTGVEDSTAAIQAAMDDHDGNENIWRQRNILYFPDGTYRLTGPIRLDTHDENTTNGGSGRGIIFQGQSRDGVVLKLDDGVADFDGVEGPRVLVDFNEANDTAASWQFVGFQIHIKDLTIDVGSANPGAIGLDFAANNCGGLENVRIRSSDPGKVGHTGLLLSRLPGPHFLSNIEVDGFDYGIRTDGANPNYQTTLEDVVVRNSRINGIQNNFVSMNIHRLTTGNIGQAAVQNNNLGAFLLILDGTFQDGNAEFPAIENNGYLYVRNIRMQGHHHLLVDHKAGNLSGPNISEWVSGGAVTLFPTTPLKSLNLPILDPPESLRDPVADWVSVLEFGAVRNDDSAGAAVSETIDDAPAFQEAMDSTAPGGINEGKRTLYFPSGQYIFKSGVTIPPSVERIVGCFSAIQPLAEAKDTVPCFTIASGPGNPLVIEQLTSDWSDRRVGEDTAGTEDFRRATPFIKNESDRTVVLKDIWVTSGQAYRNIGTGKLFIENVSGTSSRYGGITIAEPLPSAIPQFDFGGQDVWARQLNSEQKNMNVLSDGGDVWLLGMKNEEDGTFMKTVNGGRAEILGGVIMPLDVDNQAQAGFELVDSSMSIVVPAHTRSSPKKKPGGLFTGFYELFYDVMVRETRGGETRDLLTDELTEHRNYYTIPPKVLTLFRGSVYSASENWRLNHFNTAENAGHAADLSDPDADSLTNLQERAHGRDPLVANIANLVEGLIVEVSGEYYPALSFDRLTGGAGTAGMEFVSSGIEYRVQYTSDLNQPWKSVELPLTIHAGPLDQGDGTEAVTIRSTVPVDDPAHSQFLRLLISESIP